MASVAASEGAAAARKVIEGAWSRSPNLRPLAHTYIQWLRGAGAAEGGIGIEPKRWNPVRPQYRVPLIFGSTDAGRPAVRREGRRGL